MRLFRYISLPTFCEIPVLHELKVLVSLAEALYEISMINFALRLSSGLAITSLTTTFVESFDI